MSLEKVLTGTEAAAQAALLARVEVVPAYPITPQTVIVETLADMIGRGELKARYINVESEHSAMASCIGAAAVGARTFTASSSQGLALMHEVLHYAANGRMPVVMVNANRALAPPWNLYCDQSDSLSQRDTGWLQYYCTDCQDVLDSILIAYKVAEEVALPVMINLDAFYLTHTSEPVEIPDQDRVDAFIPKRLKPALDSAAPVTFGNVCGPELYTSLRFVRHRDTLAALETWEQASGEFEASFGRSRPALKTYRTEDAETVLVVVGSAAGAVRLAVDRLRDEGLAVGSLNLSLIRPFPARMIARALAGAGRVVVVERAVSNGLGGIIGQEIRAGLFQSGVAAEVVSLVTGLGGKDVVPEEVAREVAGIWDGPLPTRKPRPSTHLDRTFAMTMSALQRGNHGAGPPGLRRMRSGRGHAPRPGGPGATDLCGRSGRVLVHLHRGLPLLLSQRAGHVGGLCHHRGHGLGGQGRTGHGRPGGGDGPGLGRGRGHL